MLSEYKEIVDFTLDDRLIKIEAIDLGGEEDVAFVTGNFDDIAETIKAVANKIYDGFSVSSPDEVEIEFGVSVEKEAGKILPLIIGISGAANFSIRIKWKKQ